MDWRGWVLAAGALAVAPVAAADEREIARVYFEWDSLALSVEAWATVQEIAPRVRACEYNGVRVVGHTDTSEDNSAEVATARAKAVRDALVSLGVANSAISAVGQSDQKPAVETGPNVREILNRRAEIILVCG